MEDYYKMPNNETQIVEFKDEGFTFLFDMAEDNDTPFIAGQSKEARVVAAYGITQSNRAARDKSRMQGFIGGFNGIPRYNGYDKGHFISHKIGGMLDQNLFPHKLEPNRGYKTRNE